MACFTINRKRGYLRVRTRAAVYEYPLAMAEEFKTQNDQTWQQVADALARMQDEHEEAAKRG